MGCLGSMTRFRLTKHIHSLRCKDISFRHSKLIICEVHYEFHRRSFTSKRYMVIHILVSELCTKLFFHLFSILRRNVRSMKINIFHFLDRFNWEEYDVLFDVLLRATTFYKDLRNLLLKIKINLNLYLLFSNLK